MVHVVEEIFMSTIITRHDFYFLCYRNNLEYLIQIFSIAVMNRALIELVNKHILSLAFAYQYILL